MKILTIHVGDILHMKKKHACGTDTFNCLRIGSDIRIRCRGCGRDVTVPRIKLESSIKKIERTAEGEN
ncbi:MAG: DUF951 domain-containing protein [Ruminococcaceae bacterium]|nr:DUF951 domain-containing protein [Oscillospiraceae bacterium]